MKNNCVLSLHCTNTTATPTTVAAAAIIIITYMTIAATANANAAAATTNNLELASNQLHHPGYRTQRMTSESN